MLGVSCAFHAQFHVRHYSDTLFDDLGVAFPEALRGSVAKRRAEFLAGRALARQALMTLGVPHASVPSGEHREPVWPVGLSGSISHTRRSALCAIGDRADLLIGVDIEEMFPDAVARSVRAQVLAPDEEDAARWSGAPEAVLPLVLSGKESLFKALFPQVRSYFGFEAARLRAIGQDDLVLELRDSLGSGFPAGRRFRCGFAWSGADEVMTWLVAPLRALGRSGHD